MRVRDNSHNDEQVSKDSDQVHGEKQLKYEGLQFWFGEGTGTPLQYSCLENPMDGGAWWAAVHGVAKSRTRLSDLTHRHLFDLPHTLKDSAEHLDIEKSCNYAGSITQVYFCHTLTTEDEMAGWHH